MAEYQTLVEATQAAMRRRHTTMAQLAGTGALVAASAVRDGWDDAFIIHHWKSDACAVDVGALMVLEGATHAFRITSACTIADDTFTVGFVRDARLTKDVIAQLDKPKEP